MSREPMANPIKVGRPEPPRMPTTTLGVSLGPRRRLSVGRCGQLLARAVGRTTEAGNPNVKRSRGDGKGHVAGQHGLGAGAQPARCSRPRTRTGPRPNGGTRHSGWRGEEMFPGRAREWGRPSAGASHEGAWAYGGDHDRPYHRRQEREPLTEKKGWKGLRATPKGRPRSGTYCRPTAFRSRST